MIKWIRNATRRVFGQTSGSRNPAQWLVDWIRNDHESDSWISVDGKTCLRYAPVWNAVNRICGRLAQLPIVLFTYEDAKQTKKVAAIDHPAYRLLKREPNKLMSPSVFKELMQYHALIWGNGRAEVVRDGSSAPVELIPLLPGNTKTVLVNGDKWHVTEVVVDQNGTTEPRKISDANCLHIPGLGYDGIAGYPLYDMAKNSWGLGLGQERRANRFYRNNAVPGLILEAPPGVFEDDEDAKKFLQAFRSMHEGLDNTSRTGLLRNGITAKPLSMSDVDAQTIEQRKFQRQDVALWFMLETILGDDDSESYNSLEQKQLAELINCLNLWLVKWQEECGRKLLREREKMADSHFFQFNTGALLRADTKTTYEALTGAVRGMLLTINEARSIIDYPPIDGGDELINPAITQAGGNQPVVPDPDNPDDPSTDDPVTDDQATALANRLRSVITARLQDLVDVERKRVQSILSKDDHQAKLDSFYQAWQSTLTDALTPLVNGSVSAETIAAQWCEASRKSIADGETLVDTWTDRPASMTTYLIEQSA